MAPETIVTIKVKGRIRKKIKATEIPTTKMPGSGVRREGIVHPITVDYVISTGAEMFKSEQNWGMSAKVLKLSAAVSMK